MNELQEQLIALTKELCNGKNDINTREDRNKYSSIEKRIEILIDSIKTLNESGYIDIVYKRIKAFKRNDKEQHEEIKRILNLNVWQFLKRKRKTNK